VGFASGAVSFRRYFISGAAPADVTDAFVQALHDHAFGRHGAADPDGLEFGWITPRHLFDNDITAERIAVGRFVHLALRVDRTAPPAALVKSYVRVEEDAALQASGREFLSKSERAQARETARLRADREAKNGAFRRIAAYPVLLDLDRQTVYCGHLGSAVNDKLVTLFQDTFDCALEPVAADRLACRLLEAAGGLDGLEHTRPFHLVREPDGYDGAPDDFDAGERSFLGKEFLTWLWYKVDADEATLRAHNGDEVAVMIDRVLRLECDFALTGTDVITADGPTGLPEAKAALTSGKQPTKMGLVFGGRAGEFALVLDGRGMSVSGLSLPDDDADVAPEARLEHRFEQIAEASQLLDVLYELFLRRRTAGSWSRELGQMRAWVANGRTPAVAQVATA
jgi:hypothetical protein